MELDLADPFRLSQTWSWARAVAAYLAPDAARRRTIDAELERRGLFTRMALATRAAKTPAFRDALGAARAEREAARNEADVAALCQRILVETLGVDMTDLQVRLRRRTPRELRAEGKPRQATGIAMRITPTLEAARAAVAAVDGQPSEGFAAEISETSAPDDSGIEEQAGQSENSG